LVKTTLGGAQHGYLALVLTDNAYANISGTSPFVRPVDPGTFSPVEPENTGVSTRASTAETTTTLTSAEITTQKLQHDDRLRKFNECQAIKAILRDQIEEVIETDYLEDLRDSTTDTITSDIPTLFDNLITSYGQLTPAQLDERETNVKATTYDPAFNIISVFNIIQRFQDLCTLLKTPKTDSQLVQITYIIISRCPLFKDSLREWNKKLPEEKTYSSL